MQTFRNFVESVVEANNRMFSKRDSVLILLDEFDVIQNKAGIGSLIKSLRSSKVKFGIAASRVTSPNSWRIINQSSACLRRERLT